MEDLGRQPKAELQKRMHRFARGESLPDAVKPLGDGLYEIRYRAPGNNHYRVIFFQWGPYLLVALTAFFKNQQKTPKTALDRAKDRRTQWRQTFGERPPDSQGSP